MSNTVNLSQTVYAIGKYLFQPGGNNKELLAQVEAAYEPFESSWAKQKCLADRNFNPVANVVNVDYLKQQYDARPWEIPAPGFVIWLINDTAQQHHIQFYPKQLAIEAALLVTPAGTPVWLSGGTQAGKTTFTVALALGLGWKIVSEDFVYMDAGHPVPVVVPLSLRPGAPELILSATGHSAEPLLGTRWLVRPTIFETDTAFKNAPIAIHLSLNANSSDNKMEVSDVPWTQYVRTVLPITNAPRVENGVEQLSSIFEKAHCMRLENGSLVNRLQLLSKV